MKGMLRMRRALKANIQNIVWRFNSCPDTESEQAFIRIVVILVIIAYLYVAGAYTSPTGKEFNFFSWLAFLNAISIVVWIFFHPGKLIVRRIYSLLSDNLFVSMLMYFGEEKSIILFTIYIWVTIGYGFRYGVKYLYLSMLASIVLFTALILWTKYWGDDVFASSIGVLLSMIVVPLYTIKLINNLRSAIDRADKANQAKDRFLATVSHEMRTPLNGIKGYIDLIKREKLSDKVSSYLEPVELSANNLQNNINNILDYSKMEAGKMTTTSEAVNLNRTVESEVAVLKPLAERKGLTLIMMSDPGMPDAVSTDEAAIRSIVQNLVSNAIKFTPEGDVSVSLVATQQPDRSFVVRLVVRDTGIGIPQEAVDQLFTPFVQLDSGANRQYEGTGLGLCIIQKLAAQLGGRVSIESAPDEYTEVTVEIPVTELEPGDLPLQDTGSGEIGVDAAGKKALVVDDNEINRSLLKALLEFLGFEVETADSGKSALGIFSPNVYQIVFIDIHMPGMDGIETVNKIRSLHATGETPLVAVTADVIGLRNGEFGAADFDAVLTKPIDEYTLRKLVAKCFIEIETGLDTTKSEFNVDEKHADTLDRKRGVEFASGSEELWKNSVRRMLEMLPVQIEQLIEALAIQDFGTIQETSHFIKGSAQYVGAHSLCRCVERLEGLAKRNSVSDCSIQLDLLKEEYRKLQMIFESL
jgi:signal transduction histidine kinase/DNA-binding response OmpR family regulator